MQVFEKLITVSKEDIDELNHVNNVRYVQWIQDIAKEHWFQNSNDDLNTKYFWIVVRHHIEYKASAVLNDCILLKTFVTKSEGVKSTRVVEMFHSETNKLIVRSETVWCLMDAVFKRPSRIPQEVKNLFN